MIKNTKVYRNKFIKNSNNKKEKKNNFIYKTFYVLILFSLIILFFFNDENYNISKAQKELQKEIENEVEKIEPYQNSFTIDNVKNDFESIVHKYKYLIKKEKNIKEDCPIWTMWYQGIEAAPPIVRSCIQSIIENRAKHPVIIITRYNIDKYIKLPFYIMEKLNNNIISLTHFSDIVRVALLFKYGGYWIDSTFLITTPITKVYRTFDTLRLVHCSPVSHPFVKCLWAINFMAAGKNSFFGAFAYHAFLLYWKKYNSPFDYFILDYIVHIAYYNVQEFKDIINKIPFLLCSMFLLFEKLNSEYNKLDVCQFNKLSRRYYVIHQDNMTTHYEYLIERYKFDFLNKKKTIF